MNDTNCMTHNQEENSRLLSASAWRELRRKVRPDAQPRAHWKTYVGRRGKRVDYPVYALEDTEPLKPRANRPPQSIDLLAAVWVVNRRAKRCRDLARQSYGRGRRGAAGNYAEEKRSLYALKSQALFYLRQEQRVSHAGFHIFPQAQGGVLWAEVLEGDGYSFHCPTSPPLNIAPQAVLNQIEAKPRGSKEPKLKDALFTLREYLAEKPTADVFNWGEGRNRSSPTRQERFAEHLEYDDDIAGWS